MRFVLYGFVMSLILAVVASCHQKPVHHQGKMIFRYNESSGITSLDPAFASNQANIWAVNQLFNGLVQSDDYLNPVPSLARHWEISDDGLTYTFFLRNDVRFHDSEIFPGGKGRKVTAKDVVFSLSRIKDPKTASPGAWIFSQVAEKEGKAAFTAVNDTMVAIRLREPFPPFLGLLTMQYCSIVPYEAIEKYGKDFRRHPLGTGPFMLKAWKEGVKMILIKNDHYFEKNDNQPLPYLDAVSISFIADKQTAFLEFVKGNLHFISGLDASYKDEVIDRYGNLREKYKNKINLIKGPYLNTEYLGFKLDTSGKAGEMNPLLIKQVRQAINHGFDREQMMRYLRNNIGLPGIYGFVPAGLPWYNQKDVTGYKYDPELAAELLAEAGFPGGAGLPPITLTTNPSYLDLCKFIQSELNELGFQIRIEVTPPATLKEMMAQSRVNFFRGSWIADYPDAENYLSLFHSTNFTPAGPHYTHYSDPEFDKLYKEAIQERNDSIRGALYMELDRMIMEDAPVVVLYYDEVLRFTQQTVTGIGCNPLNLLNLKLVKLIQKNKQGETPE